MKRYIVFLCCSVVTVMLNGCGPMQMPMPVRLDPEGQKNIDQSWDKALSPLNRVDHPALLDVFLLTQAYQVGVDKLTFHSEKKVALGTVVMEIAYDQSRPDEDRFEVTLFDHAGKVLRQERFSRKEVEDAYNDLFVKPAAIRKVSPNGIPSSPEAQQELAKAQARIDAVTAIFPKEEQNAREAKEKKP